MTYTALLYTEDIRTMSTPLQSACYTIQYIDYTLEKMRGATGTPYGNTQPVIFTITIREQNLPSSKIFYERLKSRDGFPLTIIYNAEFGSNQRLSGYAAIEVLKGYIVDIEDVFSTQPDSANDSDQNLITLKILADHITYLGNESAHTLTLYDN